MFRYRACRDIREPLRPCRGSVWSWPMTTPPAHRRPCAGSRFAPRRRRIFLLDGAHACAARTTCPRAAPAGRILMTAIRGYVPPTTDEAALGVHSLDQFVLSVPDLKHAQGFYSHFGLDVREKDNSLLLHTFGHDHRWGSVVEGKRKQFHHLSFG